MVRHGLPLSLKSKMGIVTIVIRVLFQISKISVCCSENLRGCPPLIFHSESFKAMNKGGNEPLLNLKRMRPVPLSVCFLQELRLR